MGGEGGISGTRNGMVSYYAIALLLPQTSCLLDDMQRGAAATCLAFFKIAFHLSHRVCDMGKTDDVVLPRLGQRVKGRRLHLYSENALLAAPLDHGLRLAEGRISRPTGPAVKRNPRMIPPV